MTVSPATDGGGPEGRDSSGVRAPRWIWVAVAVWMIVGPFGCGHRATPDAPGDQDPRVRFEDVTAVSGIDFVNVCGSPGKEYILDSMGAGAALFDYDGDGDLDVYLVQGATRDHLVPRDNPAANRLYRNDGSLRFTDVTAAAGVGDGGWGHGAAVGDVDDDGDADLYVTNWGANVLYRNDGDGTFTDISAASGAADPRWSTSAAFADYDLDGDLDLYVANYVEFDWDNPPPPGMSWKGVPSYSGPQGLTPQPDALYRNEGDGTFVDASVETGVASVSPAYALALTWFDADVDGDPDLYVANDTTPNYLFRNDGGRFAEIAVSAGLAYNADGAAQAGMGVAVSDVDRDGLMDIFVTNFSFDFNTLYRNLGIGMWDPDYGRGEIHAASRCPMGWGAALLDVDADGDDDIAVAQGHLYPAVDESSLRDVSPYRQRNHLFLNDGEGEFSEVSERAGSGFALKQCSRALAVGDLDEDGDPDLLITNIDDRVALLRNDSARGHWLRIEVVQPSTRNRQAIAARVSVTTPDGTQTREVHGAYSYLSHNDLRLYFGLGTHAQADVTVVWPDGTREERRGVAADQPLRIERGRP